MRAAVVWRCTHKTKNIITREICGLARDLPSSSLGAWFPCCTVLTTSLRLPWRLLQVDWRVALVRTPRTDIYSCEREK